MFGRIRMRGKKREKEKALLYNNSAKKNELPH